jgi:hypothetical protein
MFHEASRQGDENGKEVISRRLLTCAAFESFGAIRRVEA